MSKRLYMQKKAPAKPMQDIERAADDLKAPDPQQPRINQYTCTSCGGVITTIDRDHGVTPFFLSCRATEGCDGRMLSSMYRVAPFLTPDHEWYAPPNSQGLLPAVWEHVRQGGLLIRRIESVGP